MIATISTIIPTIGRPTLTRVLWEILPQLREGDEILVVGDGPQPVACAMVAGFDKRVIYHEYGPTKDWGHSQRNYAMPHARGQYLFHLDDDDRCAPWALETVRRVAGECPNRPLMFRLFSPAGEEWPRTKTIEPYNVGTQMFVVPNVPHKLGVWGQRFEGDYDFVKSTLALYPEDALIWRNEWLILYGQNGTPEQARAMETWQWKTAAEPPRPSSA